MQKSKKITSPLLIALLLCLIALVAYLIYTFTVAGGKHLIPISVVAIIAGVLYEGKRLSDNWSTPLLTALGAFAVSFMAFFPDKQEDPYILENHVEVWPYYFIVFFSIFSIAIHHDKVTAKLTEGITLLQSIAVIYWVVDYGFLDIDSWFLKALMIIGLLFSLYALFHAFTYTHLSRSSRLTLSIWSCIIMLLFAIDNILRIYQNEQIENTAELTHGLYIGLQFFLLGISSMYIIQNVLMLGGFFPGKNSFFNKKYFDDLKDLKKDHIERYSDKQVPILHSLLCVLFTGAVFVLNYQYKVLPRHIAIWIIFVVFPFIVLVFEAFAGNRKYR